MDCILPAEITVHVKFGRRFRHALPSFCVVSNEVSMLPLSSEIAGIFGVHTRYQEEQNTDKSNRYLELLIRHTNLHISHQVFSALFPPQLALKMLAVLQPEHLLRVDLNISWDQVVFNALGPLKLEHEVLLVTQFEGASVAMGFAIASAIGSFASYIVLHTSNIVFHASIRTLKAIFFSWYKIKLLLISSMLCILIMAGYVFKCSTQYSSCTYPVLFVILRPEKDTERVKPIRSISRTKRRYNARFFYFCPINDDFLQIIYQFSGGIMHLVFGPTFRTPYRSAD